MWLLGSGLMFVRRRRRGALNLLQFPTLNHRCEITSGVRLEECRALLKSFFSEQRAAKKPATGEPGNGSTAHE